MHHIAMLAAVAAGCVGAAPDGPSELISRAIKAQNASGVIDRFALLQRGTYTYAAGNPASSSFVGTSLRPRCAREEQTYKANGVSVHRVTIFDGKNLWITVNGSLVPTPAGAVEVIEDGLYRAEVVRLVALVDKQRFRLESLPSVELDGAACPGVVVKSEGRPDVSMYFDPNTSYVRRVDMMRLYSDGKRHRLVETYSGHKVFGGVVVATKRRQQIADSSMDQLQSIDAVEWIPADKALELFKR